MNVENSAELRRRIEALKREKNAIILAHYYTTPEVQAVADFLGDSLALSVRAQQVEARIIRSFRAPRRVARWPSRATQRSSPPSRRNTPDTRSSRMSIRRSGSRP